MSDSQSAKCACQHCGQHLEFPFEAAGQEVACPVCGNQTLLFVPAPEEAPAPAGDTRPGPWTTANIIAAFQGTVPRTRTSFLYQIALAMVALTMVVLPLVYLALLGAVGWAVYWWAIHGTSLFQGSGGGRILIVKGLAYVVPLFAGVVTVFFMVKPLLARRAPQAEPLPLNPSAEPVLFTLICQICQAVGAPLPTRIFLDCQVNAAAGFRRGALSFLGNDLVLVIGLPLVAGTSAREFAGVLAHEFGHFAQGFGMRTAYVIRRINSWFERVAYERDAWDVRLMELAEVQDWRLALVVGAARLAVWLSRLVLKVLMYVGHGVGCLLLRQMEYDADGYEIKLAGSETFEAMSKRFEVLVHLLKPTYKDIRVSWNLNRRLPDNFPLYLMQHDEKLGPEVRTHIEDTAGLSTTGIFHTHPSTGDRIRQARRAGEPGIFHLDGPASALFSDFNASARQVTYLHYADDVGLPVAMAKFYSPEGEAAQSKAPSVEGPLMEEPSPSRVAAGKLRLRAPGQDN